MVELNMNMYTFYVLYSLVMLLVTTYTSTPLVLCTAVIDDINLSWPSKIGGDVSARHFNNQSTLYSVDLQTNNSDGW